jgi:signal transduction histidine kinase/ActR/RegA family two-component response regulator
MRMLRADGSIIWGRNTIRIKKAADGTALGYDGALEDITGRVDAERGLQASERRLVQILEAVPLGILVSDKDGQLVYANAGVTKILGRPPILGRVSLTGRHPGKSNGLYQAYIAGTDQLYPLERTPLVRALSGEESNVDDMEIRLGDRLVSITVKGAPILDGDGKVVAAVVAFIDTSDKKFMEAQLRQTSKMEAVGQLAGGIAHDFNNLLTVIMSYSSMLMETLEPGDQREDVHEISLAADRAAALTRQLLAFSRQQVMQPRVININAVVVEVENMLRRLIGEDIDLLTSLAPDVARINVDPGQLQQVLMNLTVNARDAMPNGGRLIINTSNAELSGEAADGNPRTGEGHYVMLAVSDTGEGMAKEIQQRMFEPFFTTKEQGRGTGLGLSTVYGIVKQSGGEIFVYSEVGHGTTFKVYFPCIAASADERPPSVETAEVPHGTETILLVEDDDNVRSLSTRLLRGYGYTVLVAASGVEALTIASNPLAIIDLVMTDVVMPGMNGRSLLEQLVETRPRMGALLMSGYTDDDVLRRGVLHGETAFLQKPFTPEQLARKVRSVLDRPSIEPAA